MTNSIVGGSSWSYQRLISCRFLSSGSFYRSVSYQETLTRTYGPLNGVAHRIIPFCSKVIFKQVEFWQKNTWIWMCKQTESAQIWGLIANRWRLGFHLSHLITTVWWLRTWVWRQLHKIHISSDQCLCHLTAMWAWGSSQPKSLVP